MQPNHKNEFLKECYRYKTKYYIRSLMKKLNYLIISIAIMLSACDNTVDINAPWKETPVVYAVVDLGSDTQIFRIQKTFQVKEGTTAEQIAKIADSIYMKNITVTVTDNSSQATRTFTRAGLTKQSGFFTNTDSSYWQDVAPVGFYNPLRTYTFRIKSAETNEEYTGVAIMVGRASINTRNIDLVDTSVNRQTFPFSVQNTGANSALYDQFIRIFYEEWPVNNPSQVILKYHDFMVETNVEVPAGSNNGVEARRFTVFKVSVLNSLRKAIKQDNSVQRRFVNIAYGLTAANRDFVDMINTNRPSESIVPKVGDYSNIKNAIGIFGSKTTTLQNQTLNSASIDFLNNTILNP
jgi:hypothetical protein